MAIQHLTGATEPRRPDVCRGCVWWQTQGDRSADKRRWIHDVEDEFGAWGEIYLDGERHVASLQFGPAPAFPRARTLPSAVFSTRSFKWYHVSGFHAKGIVTVRLVSGCHGSRCSIWLLP